ncbi:transaldolase family protein [Nocardia sp. NPDC051981]|uniref:transaldolase family protein n=1 Tax=Nocardia sp. NPDC051981 TaxID=3155417 RepID=UPI003439D4A7
MPDPLTALTRAGVSIWLDDLSRERLADGSLADLVRDRHVVGTTTSPTIFAKAITGSDCYADQIRALALRRVLRSQGRPGDRHSIRVRRQSVDVLATR